MVVAIADPADLVASIPPLFGFTPEESVVVLALHGRTRRWRLGAGVRIDLPAARPDDAVQPDDAALAEVLSDRLLPTRPERIAAGAPHRCYEPCDCSGTLPDPGGTRTAAEMTGLGRVTVGSRDEVAAALAPDPAAGTRRRRELIDEAHRAAVLDRRLAGPAAARRDVEAVRRAVVENAAGGLAEEEIARLAVALCDPRVRDIALGFAAGCDPDVDPVAAEDLWRALVRAVPAPEVAEPATLLAFASLDHGGGATLTTALERASTADPEHRLSRLLASMLVAGQTPETARTMVVRAAEETSRMLA